MLEYIRVNLLKEGDKLARTIYDAKGMVLLKEECKLTQNSIKAIKTQGFKGIYIEKVGTMNREMVHIKEPIIDDYTTIKVVNLLRNIFYNKKVFVDVWDKKFTEDRKTLEQYVDDFYSLFHRLNIKGELIFEMDDGRTNDNWIEYHSFNTMQIAMAMAIRLGYPEKIVKELGIGALLHDIGKFKYPELVNKKDLQPAEIAKLREHPRAAFDLLSQLAGSFSSIHCTYGCWQSHELFDGTGYPLGISGQKVTNFGYIVGIASRFDNMVHCTPFNDNPMDNNDALEMLMGSGKYPIEIVKALCEVVSAYPVGVKVELSNNETGIVLSNNVGLPMRPVLLVGFRNVDMVRNDNYRNVVITRTIKEEE